MLPKSSLEFWTINDAIKSLERVFEINYRNNISKKDKTETFESPVVYSQAVSESSSGGFSRNCSPRNFKRCDQLSMRPFALSASSFVPVRSATHLSPGSEQTVIQELGPALPVRRPKLNRA